MKELEIHCNFPRSRGEPPTLPASARRFSSTLRVATFGGFRFPDGGALLFLPVLKQLSLWFVTVSESSLHSLLAGCPVLQSLLLAHNIGFSCLRIMSSSLRSIGVHPGSRDYKFQRLIIQDAPCLERLLLFGTGIDERFDISVISAPKLSVLGTLFDGYPRLQFDTTVFQGSNLVGMATVVRGVKVLALTNTHLSLDVIINLMNCFPCLENLYIKAVMAGGENAWCHKRQNLIGTLDIGMKKIVLKNYRGNTSHVNFAKFFVLNARVLQSMVLEIEGRKISCEWIEKQHKLLQTKNRASRGARFDFVRRDMDPRSCRPLDYQQAHELSIADPFSRFRHWVG